MCGIVGILNLNKESVDQNLLKKMVNTMSYRGPDDQGFYIKENIGLGHCRLSIIDLSKTGHQPMSNENTTIWIVYNGEIYNYLELGEELKRQGHTFKSKTDTEVILHSYEEWGSECLNKFNGMWAFAIWDEKKNQLFCSRDRFGIKPFYYYFDGKTFVFASEIKALILCPFIKKEPNEPLIYDYLALGLLNHTSETFFKNVKQLEPGHYLIIASNSRSVIKKYYQLPYNPELGKFEEKKCQEYAQDFLKLLKDSVRSKLRSDVPLGSCLSGGTDSSTVVCLINKLLQEAGIDKKIIGHQQKTFTSSFEDLRFDEIRYVQRIIEAAKAEPYYVFPTGEKLWQELSDLIWHQEEPFNSTSVYAQWNVMRLAKENGVKVLLDGQGGDELLAGYPRYIDSYFNQLLFKGKILTLLKEFRAAKKVGTQPLKKLFFHPLKEIALSLPQAARLYLRQKLNPELRFIKNSFLKKYKKREIERSKRGKFNLQKRLWEDHQLNLRSLLRYEDKNSMAFSIEVRSPFLDYRLVEFTFSLPAIYKIHQGWSKYLLRVATKDLLPEEIRWRKDKMGFVTPEMIWLRENREKIRDVFKNKDFRSNVFVNQKLLLDNFDSFLNKKDLGISEIWKFINLELWLRKFF